MAYLPTQPVLPYLRGAIDVELLGQGGLKSGIQALVYQLQRITGNRMTNNTRSDERLLIRILRGEVTQLRERTADALAAALGMHPRDIWNDWYELTRGADDGDEEEDAEDDDDGDDTGGQ